MGLMVTLVSLAARSSLTLIKVGEPMMVVSSLERTPPRWTGMEHAWQEATVDDLIPLVHIGHI